MQSDKLAKELKNHDLYHHRSHFFRNENFAAMIEAYTMYSGKHGACWDF